MSSLPCEKLLWPLVAVVAFGVVSCGGKASSEERNPGAGGASGASSSGGAGGVAEPDPGGPEPSTVQVSGNDGDIDPQATPVCLQGFQGFSARVEGMSIEFHAFVFEPGDYEGDPLRILWLEVFRADGGHYLASAGQAEGSGKISLHVERIEPRFIGSLEASLPALDDPMRAPLMLALDFDIAVRAGCR